VAEFDAMQTGGAFLSERIKQDHRCYYDQGDADTHWNTRKRIRRAVLTGQRLRARVKLQFVATARTGASIGDQCHAAYVTRGG
jgi:hypothetical protein